MMPARGESSGDLGFVAFLADSRENRRIVETAGYPYFTLAKIDLHLGSGVQCLNRLGNGSYAVAASHALNLEGLHGESPVV